MDRALTELIGSTPIAMIGASEGIGWLWPVAIAAALIWFLGMTSLGSHDGKVVAGPEWLAVGLLIGLQALLFQI